MPITKDVLVKHFSDRFLCLEEGVEIGSIADILNLSLSSLKDSTKGNGRSWEFRSKDYSRP